MQRERPALIRIGGTTTGGPKQAEEVVPPDSEVNPTVIGAGRRGEGYALAVLDIGFPRIEGGDVDVVGNIIVDVRLGRPACLTETPTSEGAEQVSYIIYTIKRYTYMHTRYDVLPTDPYV